MQMKQKNWEEQVVIQSLKVKARIKKLFGCCVHLIGGKASQSVIEW